MKILRALAALSAIFALGACSELIPEIPDIPVTGVFIDSAVEGLGYECGSDDTRFFTNAAGEFTCNAGQEIRFYVGELLLGSMLVTPGLEVVTPVTLAGSSLTEITNLAFGGDPGDASPEFMSSLLIAGLLQSLDEDGDPENGITLPAAANDLFPDPIVWDAELGEDSEVVEDVLEALDDAEIELPDFEEAFDHLLAESAKLIHGHYVGSIDEEEGTVRLDLFVFENPGGGEQAGPGLQLRVLEGDSDGDPLVIEPGPFLSEVDGGVVSIDYGLGTIVVTIYDMEAIEENQIEIGAIFEGELALSALAPYVDDTIEFEKQFSPPDASLRDMGEFLATLPNGEDVPEDLEEMRGPKVFVFAHVLEEMPDIEIPMPAIAIPEFQEPDLWLEGPSNKVGISAYGSDFMFEYGHAMLASLDEASMVYRGRTMYYYMVEPSEEPGELEMLEPDGFETWGDLTITIDVDGSMLVELDGDDGSSLEETFEVGFAGVGSLEQDF